MQEVIIIIIIFFFNFNNHLPHETQVTGTCVGITLITSVHIQYTAVNYSTCAIMAVPGNIY